MFYTGSKLRGPSVEMWFFFQSWSIDDGPNILRKRGYTRRPESLFRVMRKLGLFPATEKKKAYKSKPYEQMTYPGQRVQVDVKVVPRRCIADPELRLFQYTAVDEFSRLRFLAAYPE